MRRGAEAYGPYTKGVLPFTVKEVSSEQRGDVTVRDVTFSPGPRREVNAYLVAPKGNGPSAGVLRVHWRGEDKSNRNQFLEEAVELAPKGTASLLVDTMWFHVTNFKLWQICFDYDNDFACMERETKLAIELNPNYS